jgi:hypothetical protein
LRQILGFHLIPQITADEVEEGLLVLLDQFAKRRTVAAFYAQHEGGIKVGVFRHGRLSLFNPARATRFRFLGFLSAPPLAILCVRAGFAQKN